MAAIRNRGLSNFTKTHQELAQCSMGDDNCPAAIPKNPLKLSIFARFNLNSSIFVSLCQRVRQLANPSFGFAIQ
jgi:hypothetical protein